MMIWNWKEPFRPYGLYKNMLKSNNRGQNHTPLKTQKS